MALILAVRGVADFFREGEIGVLQGAHDRRVHTDVERFHAVRSCAPDSAAGQWPRRPSMRSP